MDLAVGDASKFAAEFGGKFALTDEKLEIAAKFGLPLGTAIFGFARQAERKICVLSAKFKMWD